MNKCIWSLSLVAIACFPIAGQSANGQRQAEVAKLGAEVMPFNLKDTTHVFTKTNSGGTQRVVAKDASNAEQTKLVRAHLKAIQGQFQKGDFSGPSHIHGVGMPGLVELESSKPGKIKIAYKDVPGGAELAYRAQDGKLVTALHKWVDAQLSDHGADAKEGHPHLHGNMPKN